MKITGDTDGTNIGNVNEALVTTDMFHYATHHHNAQVVSKLWPAVPTGESRFLWSTIGCSNCGIFTVIAVNGEGAWHLKIYENPDIDDATAKTLIDVNRDSPRDLTGIAFHGGTVNSYGTKLFESLVGGGFGTISGGDQSLSGWHFKAGQTWLVRMTNASGADADCSINILGLLER